MRFLIFGAGAIGAYVGGNLALAGQHEVVFFVRPETAAALHSTGLTLQQGSEIRRIPSPDTVTGVEDSLARGPFDAAVLAVKSYDTRSILEPFIPWRDRFPPLLCLQNGVENEALIASLLGEERVIPGSVTTSVSRPSAGEIRVERLRGVAIAAGHPLSQPLAAAFEAAGMHPRLCRDARSMKWSKLLTNLTANASSAILALPPERILADRRLFRMELEQLREASRVMARLGIPVCDLPGTPVRLLAVAATRLPVGMAQALLRRSLGKGRGAKMPSLYLDLLAGRNRSEVDSLNGAVVRFGGRCGVPTPVNRVLNDTLLALVSGAIPAKAFAGMPDALLDRVNTKI